MPMKPPDEAQATDGPNCHHGQVGFTGERLAEGEHDQRHGEHAEHKED
jgi:hypothetical protein